MIVFDIETGPLPEHQIADLIPPFDPDSVKTGNIKDPVKIQQKIQEAEDKYYAERFDKAALSAMTGQVLAIGVMLDDGEPYFFHRNTWKEGAMLSAFWGLVIQHAARRFVGFNILGFDLPFLMQRSWLHRLPVPASIRTASRYQPGPFVDLMQTWNYTGSAGYVSLDSLCQFFGIGRKNGHGAEFAKLYEENETAALEYLANDLRLTHRLAERMGVGR